MQPTQQSPSEFPEVSESLNSLRRSLILEKSILSSSKAKPSSRDKSVPPKQEKLDPEKARNFSGIVARKFPRRTILYKGAKIQLYSLAWLASLSGKSTRTFHSWERQKLFPKPIFQLSDGYRWYCAAEIHGYRRLVKAAGIRSGRYTEGQSRMAWLKTHSFDFKTKLQSIFKHSLGSIPVALSDEDEILKTFAQNRKLKLSESDIIRLIKA